MLTLALALATILSAAPQNGVVYTAEGGRLRGNVLEAGPGGVSVQLPDGSTRKLDAAQVARVDFADGTTWSPKPAAPAAAAAVAAAPAAAPQAVNGAAPQAATGAAPPPAVAAAVVAAPVAAAAVAAAPAGAAATNAVAPAAPGPSPGLVIPPATAATVGLAGSASTRPTPTAGPMVPFPDKLDTVYLARGGRVRGLVVEETQDGVVMRLVDGSERRFGPGQVARIEYSNGTTSVPPDAPPVKSGR